jgi:integrase
VLKISLFLRRSKLVITVTLRVAHGSLKALSNFNQTRASAFTIAQLLGHSDVRVTMRYVRMVEDSKRVAVEAMKLTAGKVDHVLASWPKQPPMPAAVNA